MFVVRYRQTQRTQRLIRHRTQLITAEIGELATMQTTFNAILFHQTQDGTPARFRADHLLTHLMILTLQLTQALLQVIHLRFTEGELFLQLIAAGAVVAQCSVELIAANARAFFARAVFILADRYEAAGLETQAADVLGYLVATGVPAAEEASRRIARLKRKGGFR